MTAIGNTKDYHCLMSNTVVDLHLTGDSQCFPFYVYDEDGSNRRENITDWALAQFRNQYGDKKIGKWDIFYYVYGLLHHPLYRERYADNLKRELPRIPFAPDFWAFSEAGKLLADLHLGYEDVGRYRLEWDERQQPVNFHVEKMRLRGKTDRADSERTYHTYTALEVNETLTLRGIPAEAFDYRLGNRSALEWVVDQYRIKEDSRSGIVSDPNAYGDDRYIVELVEKVVTVSVETVGIVEALAGYGIGIEA
jgi:predicted helicase